MTGWWPKFDDFLIDRVAEPATHWVLARWGKSCFWLEKQTYGIAFAAFILWVSLWVFDSGSRGLIHPFEMAVNAVMIAACFVMWNLGRMIFRSIDLREIRLRQGSPNDFRFSNRYQRLFLIGIVGAMDSYYLSGQSVGAKEICSMVYFTLLPVAGYLAACTPPPPSRKKNEVPAGMQPALR